jgi:hypothetical protein
MSNEKKKERQPTKVFTYKIDEMEKAGIGYSEPESFSEYKKKYPIPKSMRTADCISVQTQDKMKWDLREYGYMVFRLGRREENDQETYFALAKLRNKSDWSEYFLLDQELFDGIEGELFLPNVSIRQLFAFNLLSELTENSLINLAISSGLMASALEIETSESLAAPASASGVFDFRFKPNPDAPIWDHRRGQVEIDALFVGRRGKQEILFVIEAKTSPKLESLAKYKLIYPILALQDKIPDCIQVIPVYLRVVKQEGKKEIDFYIAECDPINLQEVVAVSALNVSKLPKHYVLFRAISFS